MAPLIEQHPAQEAPPRRAWQRLLPVLALIAVAWFGVRWLTSADHRPSLTEGPAPDVQMVGFDGSEISLAALRGQGVVVNFWASWCGPCRVEADLFEAAWRAERDQGITFVGVNRQDTRDAALAFLDEYAISYPNGADDGSTWSRSFGVIGLPTTFFIDTQSTIKSVVWGPITNARELSEHLDKIRP